MVARPWPFPPLSPPAAAAPKPDLSDAGERGASHLESNEARSRCRHTAEYESGTGGQVNDELEGGSAPEGYVMGGESGRATCDEIRDIQGRPSNKKIQKVPSYLLPLKIRKWGMESTFVPFLKIRKWELRSSEMAHREAKTEYLGAYNLFSATGG